MDRRREFLEALAKAIAVTFQAERNRYENDENAYKYIKERIPREKWSQIYYHVNYCLWNYTALVLQILENKSEFNNFKVDFTDHDTKEPVLKTGGTDWAEDYVDVMLEYYKELDKGLGTVFIDDDVDEMFDGFFSDYFGNENQRPEDEE